MLSQHREELERLAQARLEQETLDEPQLQCQVTDADTPVEQVRKRAAECACSQGQQEALLRARH